MQRRSQILRLLLLLFLLRSPNGAIVNEKEKQFALDYLKEYHYLSPVKDGNHNFKDAVRIFQEHSDIPDTGQLDDKTIAEMHKPRCGVPDMDEEDTSSSGRIKRFSVSGRNWTKSHLTYSFKNYASNGGLNEAQQRGIVERAFQEWENIGPISFSYVTYSPSSSSDITISFVARFHSGCIFPFDGRGGKLAHAFFPELGVVHFDDDEEFTDGTSTGTNLFSVALHEIGHLLGLKHSLHTTAIMHETYKKYDPNMKLTDEEKHGIDYIYMKGTAQPDTTPSSGKCADKAAECGKFKELCKDTTLAGGNMRKTCPKTCGQCGGQGVSSCTDAPRRSRLCAIYKKNHLCTRSKFVKNICKKTCGLC